MVKDDEAADKKKLGLKVNSYIFSLACRLRLYLVLL